MLTMLCKSTLLGMRLATVCVMCYVVRDWLWITWEDSCCACEFVEGVGVTDLLFRNQYIMLMEYLHI